VNGQRSGNGASNASGTAAGEVGLPGGSVESVTGAVVGRGSSVGFSGFRFVSANSTRGAPARFETGNSASRGEQSPHSQSVASDDGARFFKRTSSSFSGHCGWQCSDLRKSLR